MEVDLSKISPDVRKLYDMKDVIYDQEWLKTAENIEMYSMYRGIKEDNSIRYDITIIPPGIIGQEFSKTKGHYHIGKYQEVYTVLEGQSIYFLQKKSKESEDVIKDVYAVKCNKGDVIVIPSDYGHITINPSKTLELKMANWIFRDCQSDYSLFEKLKGACYYYIQSQNNPTQETWIKNEHYKSVPPLRFEEPLKLVPKDLSFLKEK